MLRFLGPYRTLAATTEETPIRAHDLATRAFGMLTAGYGAYALTHPQHLARQAGLDAGTAARVGRVLGVRDVASGAVIAMSPGPLARNGLVVRAAFDAIDAVGFGLLAPTPRGRRTSAGAATAWGTVAGVLAATAGGPADGGRP